LFTLAVAAEHMPASALQVLAALAAVEGQTQLQRQMMHKVERMEEAAVAGHRDLEPQALVALAL
jgi:hypothetical protein